MCWRPIKDVRHALVGAVMCCVLLVHQTVCLRLTVVLYALEMLEGMRRVLLCMLEAVGGELCLLEVLEAMRGELLCYAGGCGG